MSLVVISTHPIQYHAPVYRQVQQKYGIPVTAIYGSDFSVAGYRDREFGVDFSWDTDLLSGYRSVFLSQVSRGGAMSPEQVSVHGLGKALRDAAPTAILLLGYGSPFYQRAFWYARRTRAPLLFRGETIDHGRSRGLFRQWVRDGFLRLFYRQFSKLLYIGQRSLEHYQRLGCHESKFVFSPYCVDTSTFQTSEQDRIRLRDQVRDELNVPPDSKVILFSGKLVTRKRLELLIQSVKASNQDLREKMVILFLGDGYLKESLVQLAQLNPSVQVRFVGFQNQSFLSRYYHAADLLVLPSYETWGLVVNEALHHGLPCVVSSTVGCAPDLVKPGLTGEIFESGSVASLRSSLEKALRLVGSADIRTQCRQLVSGYTVERAAAGIANAYCAVNNQGC